MSKKSEKTPESHRAQPAPEEPKSKDDAPGPREIGGRKGPDPTRYGDWEKAGRCIDF